LLIASPEACAEHAQDILDATHCARGLTGQLLAFSRSDRPEPAVIDLNEVVRGIQGILSRAIREDIDLHYQLTTGVDAVRIDRTQLEQVVINLATNARDAMPRGGRVTIETRFVTLTVPVEQRGARLTPGRYAVLALTDTGCGLTAETRQHLFEPLFTTKPKGHGTGFGLSTCDTIIRAAGGLIFADSEPGTGSVFTVLLPAATAPAPAVPGISAPVAGQHRGHESVLLLEDSAGVRAVVRRTLEGFGYRVFEAATAEEALALAGRYGVALDLVLSDVILPKTGGAETVGRLQALVPGIKALFMSGHTTEHLVRENRLPPGANFIQKPFERDAFGRTLRAVLDA
jgi:CheY-like chemotaxis protein